MLVIVKIGINSLSLSFIIRLIIVFHPTLGLSLGFDVHCKVVMVVVMGNCKNWYQLIGPFFNNKVDYSFHPTLWKHLVCTLNYKNL